MKAIDLFAGFGGSSTGAKMAGVEVLWAGNHWEEAVSIHAKNHPEVRHVCQDLHQANWAEVPAHDLMMASPCCQGHSKARGKKDGNPEHDTSRSTAWAIVSAAEYHRPYSIIVENVADFLKWILYPAWEAAMQALGYSLCPHIIDCADLGVPQNRIRLFIICTQSKTPLKLELPRYEHIGANSFIDFSVGKWSPINKPNRAAATLDRVSAGRVQFGERFLMPYYGSGSGLTGRCLTRPVGTITTRDRWAIVNGDHMRMINTDEVMSAMTLPANYIRPHQHKLTIHMAGNAVPPKAMSEIISTLKVNI